MKRCFCKVPPSLHFLNALFSRHSTHAEFLIQLVVKRHKLHELPQLLFHVLFYLTQLTFKDILQTHILSTEHHVNTLWTRGL